MREGISLRGVMQLVSLLGFLGCVLVAVLGYRAGIFSSQQAMQDFIARLGMAGIFVFTAFQAVQVVIPILPGGVACLVGVLLFGPVKGFFCNYIGCCVGSMLAFAIAKSYGRPLLPVLFSEKTIRRYESWTDENSPFARWFAIAIFLPVAPDDFLCFLAGTTAMRFRQFTAIIWLCKPFSIALYSLGLVVIWQQLQQLWF